MRRKKTRFTRKKKSKKVVTSSALPPNVQNKINDIRVKWVSGKHPISFAGIPQIKRHYPATKVKIIERALAGIDSYTLYRRQQRPRNYNPIYVYNKRELMQCDLICFSNPPSKKTNELTPHEKEKRLMYSKANDGNIYLLSVIDSFTRFAWIKPMTNKDQHTVLKALQELIKDEMGGYFGKKMLTDEGGEFVNNLMKNWMQKEGIERVQPNYHAPTIERFNQTFQNMLFRLMNQYDDNRYIDYIDIILHTYNNRFHRIIKMSPAQAEKPENYNKLLENVKEYYKRAVGKAFYKKKKPKFKIGDTVRISVLKTKFAKGYHKNFKEDVYKISEVMTDMPIPMYKIVRDDDKGTPEVGSWYEAELQLALPEETKGLIYKTNVVDRRINKGKPEVLVRYVYWPEKYNQWQPEDPNIYKKARHDLRQNE